MADIIGSFTVEGRAYLRDEIGRFEAAVDAGSASAAEELGSTFADLVRSAIAAAGLVRTGGLLGSVTHRMLGAALAEAEVGSDHAAPLEFGARPHQIPGAFGIVAGVFHPGNRAYRFFEQAEGAIHAVGPSIVRSHLP